jgi:hypothetical protein
MRNRVTTTLRRPVELAWILCVLVLGISGTGFAQASPEPVITAVNLSRQHLVDAPMTFGQPFRAGDIPSGNTIAAYLGGQALPTQVDVKARNADGSLRHAVLTVRLPELGARASEPLQLRAESQTPASGGALTLADVLATRFDASIDLTISGRPWHLDVRKLLLHAQKDGSCRPYNKECSQWLSGPLVSEWIVGGPVLDANDKPNPHLAVYFAVRAYGPAPVSRVRVDVTVENDWAYAAKPQNITYSATVNLDGQPAYAIHDLTHYRQARWHKVFWWGTADPVYAQLDSDYLQASMAVPRYGAEPAPARFLEKQIQECAPMKPCNQTPTMANTGAQSAIGPLPQWTSVYVINPTYRAFRWMLANSDALGAYNVHYRDQATGQPVSPETYPCMTTLGPNAEVARCPVSPHADDRFPRCAGKGLCKSPLIPDESHHPSPAYVAYLVTGDWYYLTELKDWADWVVFRQNPAYRHYADGLIEDTQVRGQAWALRTLGYAAYILPDDDPFKRYFNKVVDNNIRWYNKKYSDNPDANKLHVLTNGYAVVYRNHGKPGTGISIWQQSYFTWAVGNLKDLGFDGADKLLEWVGALQVNLMTDPAYCWIQASAYKLQVRDTARSPFYTSLAQAYAATHPKLQDVACNSNAMLAVMSKGSKRKHAKDVMVGYPRSPTGYPANFQIGLAAAVSAGLSKAAEAWAIFAQRQKQPNYMNSPQFAVVPRNLPTRSPRTQGHQ